MSIVKKLGVSKSGSLTVKDVGSEAQYVDISYDNSGNVIEDITTTSASVSSVKSVAKAIKDINIDLSGKANASALIDKADLVSGRVPANELPSYVDDIIEGYYNSTDGKFYEESTYTTEIIGERGIIYVDLITNSMYRWDDTENEFVEMINPTNVSLAGLTDTNISSPEEGQSLVYDATQTKWINKMATTHIIQVPVVAVGSYTYNGQAQGPTITTLDPNFNDYVTTTGATNVNAGTYTLRFSIKNTLVNAWSDLTTADKTYTYTINKANGNITLSSQSVTLNNDNTSATVTVTATGTVTANSSDTGIATVSTSGNTIIITATEETGEATITVNSAATNNYTAASQTISVSAEFTIYALVFSSDNNFTLSVGTPEWDGILEYSLDKGKTYYTWNGSELSGTTSQAIYLRGSGNTVITGSSGYYPWTFTGKYCTGNIENLLDYQTVKNGGHPTMAVNCYDSMFSDCGLLTTAPELPAMTLANYCYRSMFYNCTSLIKAPELPATTLAHYCYSGMFRNCTSLTQAPELPATTLANYCYRNMFRGCTSLTTVPKLPATTFLASCYSLMFDGCSNIKLSATQTGIYQYPFRIPTSGTGTTATGALNDMFTDTGGTFTGTPTINTTYYTDNPPIPHYLKFSSDEDFILKCYFNPGWDGTIEYLTNNSGTWATWDGSQLSGTANQPIYLRGIGNTVITGNNLANWRFTGKYCTGNIENLLDYQTVARGEHPTMGVGCYMNMFDHCTSLITTPELPATTLSRSCYFSMFRGCTSLSTLPALPAIALKGMCYMYMFDGCTSIKLSTTQVDEYQYSYRIPLTGTSTTTITLDDMFRDTGGTFTGTPTINTTYYTSNQII